MGEVTGLRGPATTGPMAIPKAKVTETSTCVPLKISEELQKHRTEMQSFTTHSMQNPRLNIHFISSLHFGIQVSPH